MLQHVVISILLKQKMLQHVVIKLQQQTTTKQQCPVEATSKQPNNNAL